MPKNINMWVKNILRDTDVAIAVYLVIPVLKRPEFADPM